MPAGVTKYFFANLAGPGNYPSFAFQNSAFRGLRRCGVVCGAVCAGAVRSAVRCDLRCGLHTSTVPSRSQVP
ncbi:hypothetical protein BV898_14515 [Hypsibius exemplaris]|uniref:Uncharacterized protein n=1 Tax=Hypsibius exemplaris TaxID=2072580 RepID=A0A9X6RJE0_HYPEX|nr:hypothetical protein BV898_14515 [Hypsibius exemplaris]